MRKAITLGLLFWILTLPAIAQQKGNIELFNQEGKKFYVILNGQQMHQNPETNVQLKRLKADRYSLKIIFEDSTIASIDKNVIVKPGYELTYQIKKNMFDEYTVSPHSKSEIASSDAASNKNTGTDQGNGNDDSDDQSNKGHKQSKGVSISVSVRSSDSSYSTTVKTRTRTTQVKSKGKQGGSTSSGQMDQGSGKDSSKKAPLPDYNGPIGCEGVMSEKRFREAKSSIQNKDFADERMSQAKRMTKNNCLLTDQVQELVELFDFEDDRVEFAKFAHEHTYDQGNYYKLHDSFEFSSSVEELEEFLEKQ